MWNQYYVFPWYDSAGTPGTIYVDPRHVGKAGFAYIDGHVESLDRNGAIAAIPGTSWDSVLDR